MIRIPSIRRLIVTLLLLTGPLTQFQTLYACELMDDSEPQMICCCDEPGDMGMMGCAMDASCQDQSGTMANGCCEISYQSSEVAPHPSFHAQQVVMLDAPQPPPIPVSFHFPDIIPPSPTVAFVFRSSLLLPDKPVYLLTSRFRI
ncbi:MAG: hypothetical protein DRR06_08085 [Gammaproteobacteria bacterium]|nr:MAG: hypothetical protein DRR06_08085 [Gammaproteobacteria bacterium]RLA51292.1 MAG: hypothetical protein DRR42_10755 [Gammaproteobacteria bacterium]